MSGMHLQFITETTIGPKERRLIRSHVMKGRNLGRPRPSRKKLYGTCQMHGGARQPMAPAQDQPRIDEVLALDYRHTFSVKRLLWNDLTLTSFPYHIGSESMKYVYQWLWATVNVLYPPQFCSELDLSRYSWFQYVFEDKACFHCLLAVSASFTDRFGGNLKLSSDALNHLSRAYRLISERLSGPEAFSDKAIAVVIVLAIYHNMHRQQSSGLIHFNGLCRIIQFRGGLEILAKENRALAHKSWRLALEFALRAGSPASFDIHDVPGGTALRCFKSSQELQSILGHTDLYDKVTPRYTDCLVDITNFTKMLNSTREDTKLDPMDYSEFVFRRLHSLLHIAPLGPRRPVDPLDNLVHLALVAVMTTLLPEYGQNQAKYDLLSGHLRCALRNYAVTANYNHKLFSWAIFVGYATVLEDNDRVWLKPLVAELSMRLKLHSWSDVRSLLCQYPWIEVFYDKLGIQLWCGYQ